MNPLIPGITKGPFAVESELIGVAVAAALLIPRLGWGWLRRVEGKFRRLAQRKGLCAALVGLLSLGVRAAMLPWLPIPVPGVADEFSYLLQADTFAHGRLTNPTPPLWTHFQTFYEIFTPTYASKYPPMQGIFLALGKAALGHAWLGVWLSVGAMCAAICWMLQGWLPAEWALLGGLLAVARLGIFSYWANTYWGGAVAALGGALVLGALARLLRRPRAGSAWLMGAGLALLAGSRPFEGLMLSLPAGAILAWKMARTWRVDWRRWMSSVIAPLLVCAAVIFGATGYYNWRVTGNVLEMPYQVHIAQYEMAPPFVWQRPRPHEVAYRDKYMREFAEEVELGSYERMRTAGGFLRATAEKVLMTDSFFLGPALTLPLIMLPWALGDRRTRPLVWIGIFLALAIATEVYFNPHYAAPATALIYALVLECLRHLRAWKIGRRPSGRMLAAGIPIVCLLMIFSRMATGPSRGWTWYSNWPGNTERARIERRLEAEPGRQLVIVRYGPRHSLQDEWVFNAADIPDAKVIWAIDEGAKSNEELIQEYSGRRVWLMEPDENPPMLAPYAEAAGSGKQ